MSEKTRIECKWCGYRFTTRTADVKRGWGLFCSKSCKAKSQTRRTGISGPHYKAKGRTVRQMEKGRYAKSQDVGRGLREIDDARKNINVK